jgi:hypothetical protein
MTKQVVTNVKYIDISRTNEKVWFVNVRTEDNAYYQFAVTDVKADELVANLEKGKDFNLQLENAEVLVEQTVSHNGAAFYWKVSEHAMERFKYVWRIANSQSSLTNTAF